MIFILSNFCLRLEMQFVYKQFDGSLPFSFNTPQQDFPINLGGSFTLSQQYSLWGWFKYRGKQPTIMNILNLYNFQVLNQSETVSQGQVFPDPAFPDCPYSQ